MTKNEKIKAIIYMFNRYDKRLPLKESGCSQILIVKLMEYLNITISDINNYKDDGYDNININDDVLDMDSILVDLKDTKKLKELGVLKNGC